MHTRRRMDGQTDINIAFINFILEKLCTYYRNNDFLISIFLIIAEHTQINRSRNKFDYHNAVLYYQFFVFIFLFS